MHAAIVDNLAVTDGNDVAKPAETSTHASDDAIAMQKLRLNEAQWARILADNDQMTTVRTPYSTSTGLRAHDRSNSAPFNAHSEEESVQQVAYLLSLEGDEPQLKWTWYEKVLDALVQSAQPAPAMTHTELVLPPESGDDDEMHFAIYLGKQAHWGSVFRRRQKVLPRSAGQRQELARRADCGPGRRAPACAPSAPSTRARRTDPCIGSSTTPFRCRRGAAWRGCSTTRRGHRRTAPRSRRAACAARCPSWGLSRPSAWYGPSTLYLELARESRMRSYKQYLTEAATVKATVEVERAAKSADTLLRGSDDAVVALSHDECQCGVDLLTSKVVDASIDNDPTAERLMQKNLARALLRWSQINRGTPHVEHDAATGHGDEEGAGESSGGIVSMRMYSCSFKIVKKNACIHIPQDFLESCICQERLGPHGPRRRARHRAWGQTLDSEGWPFPTRQRRSACR